MGNYVFVHLEHHYILKYSSHRFLVSCAKHWQVCQGSLKWHQVAIHEPLLLSFDAVVDFRALDNLYFISIKCTTKIKTVLAFSPVESAWVICLSHPFSEACCPWWSLKQWCCRWSCNLLDASVPPLGRWVIGTGLKQLNSEQVLLGKNFQWWKYCSHMQLCLPKWNSMEGWWRTEQNIDLGFLWIQNDQRVDLESRELGTSVRRENAPELERWSQWRLVS